MDLNGYFDPVSLDRPEFHFLPEKQSFSRNISIHTPDQPIRDLDRYQLALIGLPQDEAAYIKGSAKAPDLVRGMLYQLRKINNNVKVYDLGNLKITNQINNTYFAIRDVILELVERDVIPFFIGGSQDLTYGAILALGKLKGIRQILTVDPRFDFWMENESQINSRNYLDYILNKKVKGQFTYSNIGHQQYFIAENQIDVLHNEYMESMRLGELREDIKKAEPLIRDADLISIDMNSVRHSDAPGVTTPSPNGLFGDELCALTRYGGISEKVKICGLFELSPDKDLNGQTSHLAAQAVWYFIDGLSHRLKENPLETSEHTRKFIISPGEINEELIFYKSNLSERWWIEIPVKNPVTNYNYFISCSYDDYKRACNNVIPDRWMRYLLRLNG
ncbi:MAG: formimidoylglutamase [Bacteroidales bacterium]